MDASLKFIAKAKLMKNICAIIFIMFLFTVLWGIGITAYELSPLSANDIHTVTIIGDSATRFESSAYGDYMQLSTKIMYPTTEFPKSLSDTFAGISFFATLIQIPLVWVFWLAYTVFKELTISRTPFTSTLFNRIKRIGTLIILIGFFRYLTLAFLLYIFGFLTKLSFSNPINFYLVIIGFILIIVSEILEYGLVLQIEIDETL